MPEVFCDFEGSRRRSVGFLQNSTCGSEIVFVVEEASSTGFLMLLLLLLLLFFRSYLVSIVVTALDDAYLVSL